ncbi:MAG: HAD hydrolase-like protein [Desulfobacterales bacterium]
MNKKKASRALIVFDMDGVIVDVSRSYREAVRTAARLFFKGAASWENLPDPLFSKADLAGVKQSGGLNNDWDLTFLIINHLFTQVRKSMEYRDSDPWTNYKKTIKRCDVADLARFLLTENNPISSLLDKKGRISSDFINSLYNGDVGTGNVIKQLFQEIYLGKKLFESTYQIPSKVFHEKGYIDQESMLIDVAILESLARHNILAIATGRPRMEADYPLDFFNLKKYFTLMLTLDDCLKEEQKQLEQNQNKVSLSKPNPFMLDAIEAALGNKVTGYYYVGDMPDDMMAASRSRAGFIGIGILKSSTDKDGLRRDLEDAGADYIIQDFDELLKIVESND